MRDRGSIIQKGEGKYLVRVYLGRDTNGVRQYASKVVQGTQKDAQQAVTKMLGEIDDQTFSGRSSMSLAAFLTRWLDTKVDIAERTKRDYVENLARYVLPSLGKTRLKDLAPTHLQGLYARLQSEKNLSPRTVRYVHAILRAALGQAERWSIIGRKPAAVVTLPKMRHQEMRTLTPAEVALLLETSKNDPLYAMWCVLLTTGLRPGEALALRWEDFVGTSLHIRRAMQQVGAGQYEVRETKTKSSRRALNLPAMTIEALQNLRKEQGALTGWMFPSKAATPIDLSNLRRAWKAALRRAGLPDLRLYDARHTHITHLLLSGVHPKAASSRAGHSSITLTLDTYSHVLPEVDAAAAQAIEPLLTNAKEATNG